MSIRTLFLYLLGNRNAILTAASDRGALWLGLAFVLSAGLAREHDGEDLLHEPWHALLPLLVSLATSVLLYALFFAAAREKEPRQVSFGRGYLSFLGLYWLTAPLAWVYAIPFERFLSPVEAVRANLACLALVSLWRVLLMIRVMAVLTRSGPAAAVFLVMLFADLVAILALAFSPAPVMVLMAGARSETEQLLSGGRALVGLLCWLSLPVWVVGAGIALRQARSRWRRPALPRAAIRGTRPLRALALASLLVWVPVLPFTQREQGLRREVERAFAAGRIEHALGLMSARAREDFPPHWLPPPRIGYEYHGRESGLVVEALEALARLPAPSWLKDAYRERALELLRLYDPETIGEEHRARIASFLALMRTPGFVVAEAKPARR